MASLYDVKTGLMGIVSNSMPMLLPSATDRRHYPAMKMATAS